MRWQWFFWLSSFFGLDQQKVWTPKDSRYSFRKDCVISICWWLAATWLDSFAVWVCVNTGEHEMYSKPLCTKIKRHFINKVLLEASLASSHPSWYWKCWSDLGAFFYLNKWNHNFSVKMKMNVYNYQTNVMITAQISLLNLLKRLLFLLSTCTVLSVHSFFIGSIESQHDQHDWLIQLEHLTNSLLIYVMHMLSLEKTKSPMSAFLL